MKNKSEVKKKETEVVKAKEVATQAQEEAKVVETKGPKKFSD